MADFIELFEAGVAGATETVEQIGSNTVRTFRAPDGTFLGRIVESDKSGRTVADYFNADAELVGQTKIKVSGDRTTTEFFDEFKKLIGAEHVTVRDQYTLTESFDENWVRTGAVKEIHTSTTTGTQVYDADYNLLSANLTYDNGKGYTKVEEYGPDWTVVSRTIVDATDPNHVVTEHQGAGGAVTGGSIVTTKDDFTLTETFGPGWVRTGAVKEIHTATKTGEQVYDGDYNLLSAHLEHDNGKGYTKVEDYGPNWEVVSRTIVNATDPNRVVTEHQGPGGVVTGGTIVQTKADFTLTETFGPGWVREGAVKEIHTATKTGEQVYDGDYNLLSAHLEHDNGKGYTKVEDYGPNWEVISRTIVNATDPNRVVTEHQGAGGAVTGGTIVKTTDEYTVTETFGPGWVRTGAVKEIHTDKTTGQQVYDGDYKLLSAHLEHDEGNGYTKVEDYGPNWEVISRTIVNATDPNHVVTEHQGPGGVVTGGTIVTTRTGYTLTETFGPGWVLLGAVKEIHSDTTTGQQVYDADYNLVSAHLEIDNGYGYTKVEDYGPDWFLLSKTTVQVSGDTVTTEYQENGMGNVIWRVKKVGDDVDAKTTHVGFDTDNTFVGDIGMDIMRGGAGEDQLFGMGNDDKLYGGDDNDLLDGGAGNDRLYGEDGDDELLGGSGNDVLNGGNDNDLLIGGAGRDIMLGGWGDDTFAYTAADESGVGHGVRDEIRDWGKGDDKIDVSALGLTTFLAGNGAAFTNVAGEFGFEQVDNAGTDNDFTVIRADLDGDGAADFEIEVSGLFTFTDTDFIY